MDEGSVARGRVCLMSEMPRARRGGEGRAVGNLVMPRLPATFQLTNTSGLEPFRGTAVTHPFNGSRPSPDDSA
ncbi:unnamed protein product [Boreogadus saida]